MLNFNKNIESLESKIRITKLKILEWFSTPTTLYNKPSLFARDVGRFPNPEVDCSQTNDPRLSISDVLSLFLSQHLTAMFSSTGYGESFVKLVSKSNFTISIPKPHPLESI